MKQESSEKETKAESKEEKQDSDVVDLTYSQEEQQMEEMDKSLELKRQKRKQEAEKFGCVLEVIQEHNLDPIEVGDYLHFRFSKKKRSL